MFTSRIAGKMGYSTLDSWRYEQIHHFIASLPHPIRSGDNLLPIEKLFSSPGYAQHLTSRIYCKIIREIRPKIPSLMGKWEQD